MSRALSEAECLWFRASRDVNENFCLRLIASHHCTPRQIMKNPQICLINSSRSLSIIFLISSSSCANDEAVLHSLTVSSGFIFHTQKGSLHNFFSSLNILFANGFSNRYSEKKNKQNESVRRRGGIRSRQPYVAPISLIKQFLMKRNYKQPNINYLFFAREIILFSSSRFQSI